MGLFDDMPNLDGTPAKKKGLFDDMPVPGATAGGILRTLAASGVEGVGALMQGGGEIGAKVLNSITGTQDFTATNPLKFATDYIKGGMTEGDKLAAQDSFKGDVLSPSTWEMPATAGGVGHAVAQGLGSILPTAATALASRGRMAPAMAVQGGLMTGGAAAGDVRENFAKLDTDEKLAAASPAFAQLVAGGMSPADARAKVTNESAQTSGLLSGAAGAAGGAFNAKLLEDLIAHKGIPALLGKTLAERGVARTITGAATGAVGEGLQEGLEKVGQNAGENIGMGKSIGDDVTRDTFGDVVGGAMVGKITGGVGGALAKPGTVVAPDGGVIDPNAGPISRAAATAINTGAAQQKVDEKVATAASEESARQGEDLAAAEKEAAKSPEPSAKPAPTADEAAAANDELGRKNIEEWSAKYPAMTLQDVQKMQRVAAENGREDLAIVPHASGEGYTIVPQEWVGQTAITKESTSLQGEGSGRLAAPKRGSGVSTKVEAGAVEGEFISGQKAKEHFFPFKNRQQADTRAAKESERSGEEYTVTDHPTSVGSFAVVPVSKLQSNGRQEEKQLFSESGIAQGVEQGKQTSRFVAKSVQNVQPAGASSPKLLSAPVDEAAHAASTSPKNDLPQPTLAQIEAGNYPKGHVTIGGLGISIENPSGSTRSGTNADGKAWNTTMRDHYGYVKRSTGADKDQVDVFIKGGTAPDHSGDVYVVDQVDPKTGQFDEHKALLGYRNMMQAAAAYRAHYEKGWKGMGAITPMPMEEFKKWVKSPEAAKPLALENKNDAYEPPSGRVSDDWVGHQASDFQPTPRQQKLMDVQQRAKDKGLFYTSDILEYATTELKPTAEQLAKRHDKVSPSDFAMDVYYAGQAVDSQKGNAESARIGREMNLTAGENIGTIVTSDLKRVTGTTIVSVKGSGLSAEIAGKRGVAKVGGTMGVDTIKRAIERAHEKGLRKDSYSDFIAARTPKENKPSTEPVGKKPETVSSQEGKPNAGTTETGSNTVRDERASSDSAASPVGTDAAATVPARKVAATSKRAGLAAADAPNGTANLADAVAPQRDVGGVERAKITVDKAEVRPYRKPDGSIGYEAVPVASTQTDQSVDVQASTVSKNNSTDKKAAVVTQKPSVNTIFTEDAAAAARARLKAKLGRVSSGIDPETMMDGITLAGYHIEKGARTFAAYARAMLDDLGDGVKPYLKSWYMGVKYDPRATAFDGMDSPGKVDAFSLDNFSAEAQTTVSDPINQQTDTTTNATERATSQPNAPSLDGVSSTESGRASRAGQAGASTPNRSERSAGPDTQSDGERVPADRSGRSGTSGVSDSSTGSAKRGRLGDAGGSGTRARVSTKNARSSGAVSPAPAATNVPAANFRIDRSVALGEGSEKTKLYDNMNAIRIVKSLEAEARRATPDEQRQIARFVGWGGLKDVFPNPETGKFKPAWEASGQELREMLTPTEYRRASASTLNAHYTSETVVSSMWDMARKLGYRNGLALESSMGVGNFIGLMPEDIAARFIGVEYDPMTARIAAALYPQSTVLQSGFQDVPLPDGSFDLSIGNPPFGQDSLRFQYKPELNGKSIHNQFFLASLDALRPGGLMIQVVSRYLMDKQDSSDRKALANKAELIAAIRLPNTAFKENARTDVVTDIIILKKRAIPLDGGNVERLDSNGKKMPPIQVQYPEWVNTGTVPDPAGGEPITVNSYFVANPKQVIGTIDRTGKMNGREEPTVHLENPAELGSRLAALVSSLPENVIDTAADVAERTEEAYTLLGDALRIAVAREEPGHINVNADGQLQRIIERDYGNGSILQRQTLTPDSPWSSSLLNDVDGKWYTLVARTDDAGNKIKLVKNGKATKLNEYVRKTYATDAEVPDSLRLGKTGYDKLRSLVALRDLLKQQIVLETEDAEPKPMKANRTKLAQAYDAFVKEWGPVNRSSNAAVVSDMPDAGLILAIESSYEPERTSAQAQRSGLPQQDESVKPAPILKERVVHKYEPPTKSASLPDALAITLAESGRVDIDRIAALLDKQPDEVAAEFTESETPLAFKDPETNTWETVDSYLSGQVRRKLEAAKAAGMQANIRALEKVQPEKWGAENVTAQLGAPWIPEKIYADFVSSLVGGNTKVHFSSVTNIFSVQATGIDRDKNRQWGTEAFSAHGLIEKLLNSQTPTVRRSLGNGKSEVDSEATSLAILKGREIVSEFGDWIFKDSARRNEVVNLFNDKFNTRVSRQFDGQHLFLPGKVPDSIIAMRRHQLNAIWRGIQSRFNLYDHVVGAGKTFTAIARAMERRRMGLARKPTIVVPNHLVEQWTSDVYRLYPGAKVLAASKKDFEPKRRRRLLGKIATGDYDIVIMPHTSFGFVGLSPETELRFLEVDLAQALAAVKEAQEQAEEDGDVGFRKPVGVKEAERLVSTIEGRMAKVRDGARDKLLTFEQLGIDDLTIDEAHEFKNLYYSSRLTKVRGMGNKTGSRKAADLYNKVRVMQETGGSVTFMTGTPVSNSVVELYTMMRYLAAKDLKEMGMEHFDAWRTQFVEATPGFEPNEAGRLTEVTRLGRTWSNMRSMMDLYYSFADAVTLDDIKASYVKDNNGKPFPVPKVAGGDRQLIKVLPTPAQESMLKEVISGFDGLDGIKDIYERNVARLRLMDRARKLSLDIRAVAPSSPSKEEGGKLDRVVGEVKRIYDKSTADRGTQLIFLDRSVPKSKGDDKLIKDYDALIARRDKAIREEDDAALQDVSDSLELIDANEIESLRNAQNGGWNAYQQIKDSLVALGIPADQIRFVQEANNDEQKQALFDAVNGGRVRVLIGSTPRMGAGTNVQKRLVALHHVDVTWKPSDIEQREGRIIRQGNEIGFDARGNVIRKGFEVEILAYATERTVDAKMWSLNATKLRAINGLRKYNGDFTMEVEDEESVSMAEMAALASGNPLLLERVQLETEIRNLELMERGHNRRLWGAKDAADNAKRVIETYPDRIAKTIALQRSLVAPIQDVVDRADKRKVDVEGKTYDNYKDAIRAALASVDEQRNGAETGRFVLNINGEKITTKDGYETAISGAFGDSQPFEATIGDKLVLGRTDAGRAASEIISPNLWLVTEENKPEGKLGSMFGMELRYQLSLTRWTAGHVDVLITLERDGRSIASADHSTPRSDKIPTAVLRDLIGKTAAEVENKAQPRSTQSMEKDLERARENIERYQAEADQPFAKADEIRQKTARLRAVISALSEKSAPSTSNSDAAPSDNMGASASGKATAFDKLLHAGIAEGRTASDTLKAIQKASRNPFYRELAGALLKSGVDPALELGNPKGLKFSVKNRAAESFAAAFFPKANKVQLFTDANAERNLLHEIMHAATYRAIRKPSLASGQLRALFSHVKKSGQLKGMYGMENMDEFIAEAFSNPKFQAALKGVDAAVLRGGKIGSAFDWFVRIVRALLGLKQGQESALSQVIEIGSALIDEQRNMLNANSIRTGVMGNSLENANFAKWFGDSKVVDADGKPLVVYHGTASDFSEFKTSKYEGGIYFTPSARYAAGRARVASLMERKEGGDMLMPVHLRMENPAPAGYGVDRAKREGFDGLVRGEDNMKEYVVFEPNQIKSATGNDGSYSLDDDSIMGNITEDRDMQARIRDKANELLSTKKTFNWWNNTVGTQYAKAEKDADFKRVFDATQDYIGDVSRIANAAADQAPSLLPKTEGLRDVFKKDVSTADRAAIAKPIFQGTLTDSKVYADDELRAQFGLTDKQIGYYREHRAAIDQSLDDLLKTDLLRYVGKAATGLRDAVMQANSPSAAAKIISDRMQQVAGLSDAQVRDYLAAADDAEKVALGFNTAQITAINDIATVRDKADRIDQLKNEGYAPLMRFGRYAVYTTDQNGETIAFTLHETEREATKRAAQMRADNPDATVVQSVMSEEAYKLYAGMEPETLELFAEMSGLEQTPAFQEYLKMTKSNRSAMKRLIKREGIAGFNDDPVRGLAAFITSNARAGSKNLHFGDMLQAAADIPREKGDVLDEAVRLIKYVQDPKQEAQAIRGLLFANYIGGSLASAAVNLTQPLTMTFPYLSQFGTALAAKEMTAAMRTALGKSITNPELAAALKRAESDGIVSPQEIHQLEAEASGRFGKNQYVRKGAYLWGSMFSLAEQYNRRVTFIAAYNMAKANGELDPFKFAEKAVQETQGIYNKGNRPNWARGALGATIFTFKQFSISYLEFLMRLPQKERAIALGILLLTAGMQGMPGADDADDVIDTIGQGLGYDTNSKAWKTRALTEAIGREGAEFVMRGGSALPGFPIDVAGRMGMGNLLPGTGVLLKSKADKGSEFAEPLGAAGSFAKDVLSGKVAPLAIRNVAKAVDMYQTGMYRDEKGRKVVDTDGFDAIVKGIGFQPADVARDSRSAQMVQQTVDLAKNVESDITQKWAESVFERNQDKFKAAMQKLIDWNQKNPNTPIAINPSQIKRRIMEMTIDRESRLMKRTPKELRAQMMELYQ